MQRRHEKIMEKNSQELIATSTFQTLLLSEQTCNWLQDVSVQGQSFTYVVIVILMSNTLENTPPGSWKCGWKYTKNDLDTVIHLQGYKYNGLYRLLWWLASWW